ncbi:serine dehydratase beta chain, partial [Pseudomonas aeruginosa]|uniref:serine dehydratase beta chain n=1 Tax=Pseudomonas aeruginosa TaxID=287 RepID=UPI00237BF3FF
MSLSVFDLFKIGIGPSSSHTVGPMRAAARFAEGLRREGLLEATASVKVELYGSLGATGKGHGSDKAVLLGLEGEQPDTVDTAAIPARLDAIRSSGELRLLGERLWGGGHIGAGERVASDGWRPDAARVSGIGASNVQPNRNGMDC